MKEAGKYGILHRKGRDNVINQQGTFSIGIVKWLKGTTCEVKPSAVVRRFKGKCRDYDKVILAGENFIFLLNNSSENMAQKIIDAGPKTVVLS